jgi:hypothetical protein
VPTRYPLDRGRGIPNGIRRRGPRGRGVRMRTPCRREISRLVGG